MGTPIQIFFILLVISLQWLCTHFTEENGGVEWLDNFRARCGQTGPISRTLAASCKVGSQCIPCPWVNEWTLDFKSFKHSTLANTASTAQTSVLGSRPYFYISNHWPGSFIYLYKYISILDLFQTYCHPDTLPGAKEKQQTSPGSIPVITEFTR